MDIRFEANEDVVRNRAQWPSRKESMYQAFVHMAVEEALLYFSGQISSFDKLRVFCPDDDQLADTEAVDWLMECWVEISGEVCIITAIYFGSPQGAPPDDDPPRPGPRFDQREFVTKWVATTLVAEPKTRGSKNRAQFGITSPNGRIAMGVAFIFSARDERQVMAPWLEQAIGRLALLASWRGIRHLEMKLDSAAAENIARQCAVFVRCIGAGWAQYVPAEKEHIRSRSEAFASHIQIAVHFYRAGRHLIIRREMISSPVRLFGGIPGSSGGSDRDCSRTNWRDLTSPMSALLPRHLDYVVEDVGRLWICRCRGFGAQFRVRGQPARRDRDLWRQLFLASEAARMSRIANRLPSTMSADAAPVPQQTSKATVDNTSLVQRVVDDSRERQSKQISDVVLDLSRPILFSPGTSRCPELLLTNSNCYLSPISDPHHLPAKIIYLPPACSPGDVARGAAHHGRNRAAAFRSCGADGKLPAGSEEFCP